MKVKGSLIFPLWHISYNDAYKTFEFTKPSEHITLNIDGEFSTLTIDKINNKMSYDFTFRVE